MAYITREELNQKYYAHRSRVIQVIETKATIGTEGEGGVLRAATLYFSLDGELLAIYDPYADFRVDSDGKFDSEMLLRQNE